MVNDTGFAYWHSATLTTTAQGAVHDEWGGGTRPRCRAYDPLTWGADAIYDILDNKLVFQSHFKMPAPQGETENCVAHNGSIIPVPGRDIFVQAWYQGGVSVVDFTDSANPIEIAYFDRGPIDADDLVTGGYWSTYWYQGKSMARRSFAASTCSRWSRVSISRKTKLPRRDWQIKIPSLTLNNSSL